MFSLIVTIMAIALMTAVTLATLNYVSPWTGVAAKTATTSEQGFLRLERAYKTHVKNSGGAVPTPLATPDGGLSQHFLANLTFLPLAPSGYTWVYGQHEVNPASPFSGLNYFCLAPSSAGAGANEGIARGILRLSKALNTNQLVTGPSCGGDASAAPPAAYPALLTATYYVAYNEGVD